jgi:hypothetical protein
MLGNYMLGNLQQIWGLSQILSMLGNYMLGNLQQIWGLSQILKL